MILKSNTRQSMKGSGNGWRRMKCFDVLKIQLRQLTLSKLHIGFSRALQLGNHIFKYHIANAVFNNLNEIIANAKPAPSSAPALIGRPVVIHSFERDRLTEMMPGAPTQCLHKPFRHIQLKLNFCLHAASQLLHPKEMCLNAALNQIAFKLPVISRYFALT